MDHGGIYELAADRRDFVNQHLAAVCAGSGAGCCQTEGGCTKGRHHHQQRYRYLADEIEGAKQEQDSKKAKELSAKINDLEKKLGPEYLALAASLKSVDPNSSDAQEINSILEEFDESCGD